MFVIFYRIINLNENKSLFEKMKYQILIGIYTLFLMISLILSQENNKTKENEPIDIKQSDSYEKNQTQEGIQDKSGNITINQKNGASYIEVNDDEIQNIEIESIDFIEPLDLTEDEMDMVLLCAFISQTALKQNYSEDILDIAERIGEFDIKKVKDKIGFSFFNVCISNIDNETVNKYISNLTYHNNFVWEKKFDDYIKLDKEQYKDISDIKFSIDDQIIAKVVKQSNDEFEKRKKERNKNRKTNNNRKEMMKEIPKKENINNNKKNNKNMVNNSIFNEIIFFFGFGLILIVFFYFIHWCRQKNPQININEDINKNKDKNSKNKNKKKKVN